MTANTSIDPARFLHEELSQASPDLMRELLGTFINALLSAQADSVCGAEYGTRDPGRMNRRNATATGTSTPAPARSTSRSPRSAKGRSSRSGCSSGTAARRRR